MRVEARALTGDNSNYPEDKNPDETLAIGDGDKQTHLDPPGERLSCEMEMQTNAESTVQVIESTQPPKEQTSTSAGGQIAQVVEQPRKEETSTSAGNLVQLVEQPRKEETNTSAGNLVQLVEQPRKEQTSTSAGNLVQVVEQKQDETNTSVGQQQMVNEQKDEDCDSEGQIAYEVTANHTDEQSCADNQHQTAKTTTNQEKRCRNAMKKMFRKFLLIRRKYKYESKWW